MRKRILKMAMVIIGLVVTGIVPVTASADISDSSAIFREDFSTYESGSNDFAFGQFVGDGMALDEYRNFDRTYSIENALSLNSGKQISYGNAKVYYNLTGEDYSLTEFDLYLDKRSGDKSKFVICPSTTYGDHENFAMIRVEKNKIFVVTDGTATEICTLEENKWHHFCIKMTDAYKESDLYLYNVSLSINGDEVYSGTETRNEGKIKQLPYYDMLKISNRSYVPVAYIDNITITYNGNSKYDGMEKLLGSVRLAEEKLYEYSFMKNTPSYARLKAKYDEGIEIIENGDTAKAEQCSSEIDALGESLFENTDALELMEIGFSNGSRIMPESGKITSIKVNNKTNSDVTGTVVTAFYNRNTLVNCYMTKDCVFKTGSETVDIDDIEIENNFTDAIMYIWESAESISPIIEKIDIKNHIVSDDINIYVDNKRYFTDVSAHKMADGKTYVPAENVLNLMGASVREWNDGYRAERIDGTYMDFEVDYYGKDIVPMIEIGEIENGLGCSFTYDELANALMISSNYSESFETRAPNDGEIIYEEIGKGSFTFKVNCDSETKVEAYTRVSVLPEYKISDSTDLSSYQKWLEPMESVLVWKKAYDVKYDYGVAKLSETGQILNAQDLIAKAKQVYENADSTQAQVDDASRSLTGKTEEKVLPEVCNILFEEDFEGETQAIEFKPYNTEKNTVSAAGTADTAAYGQGEKLYTFTNDTQKQYAYSILAGRTPSEPIANCKYDKTKENYTVEISLDWNPRDYNASAPTTRVSVVGTSTKDIETYASAYDNKTILGIQYTGGDRDTSGRKFEIINNGEAVIATFDTDTLVGLLGEDIMDTEHIYRLRFIFKPYDKQAESSADVNNSGAAGGVCTVMVDGVELGTYEYTSASTRNYISAISHICTNKGTSTDTIDNIKLVEYWDNLNSDTKYINDDALVTAIRSAENGAHMGSFANLRTGDIEYDVIFKITKDGRTEMVRDKVSLKSATPEIEEVKYEASSLTLKSTFENISYYMTSDEATEAAVYYRRKEDSVWSKGYTPVYNPKLLQYTGTITGLEPNTEYDIKLSLDGIDHTASIKTWNENPQYREVDAKNYMTESGTLVLQGIKGTEDNWIKVTSDSIINGGESNQEAVYISDCEYIILDGLEIDGARRYAISVSGGSKNIRIQNCDIYGWGRLGVWSNIRHRYMRDMDAVNYDAAIRLNDAENVVIERCYIHDSNARCNTWYGADYDYNHPTGGSAIYANMKSGLVVRYNDFIGNSVNRWNDAIEGDKNGELLGGVGFDADIYGNMFFGGNDDAMELEGGGMNVRVYRNRIEQTYCGISYAPILLGPTYTFGNLVYNLGDREDYASVSLKQKTLEDTETAADRGEQFLFNNTILTKEYTRIMNTKAINNVLCSDYSVSAISSSHTGDYNFLYGHTSNISFKKNEIYGVFPGFTDATTGNFTLSQGSEARGNGIMIDNFMPIENPDMGAFVYGDKFLPARPVDMSADKYSITLKDGAAETITFSAGNVDDGLTYSIEKSDKELWLNVDGDLSGEVSDGGMYTITVMTDISLMNKEVNVQNDTLCAAVLFRLSNGYSVPITVKVER